MKAELDEILSLENAMSDIKAALENYDIPNAFVVITTSNTWNGLLFGNANLLAHGIIDGTDKKYITAEMLKDLLSKVEQLNK